MRLRWSRPACLLVPALMLFSAGCYDFTTAWLSDGEHIAYIAKDAVWITGLDGKSTKVLDVGNYGNRALLASPKGNLVAIRLSEAHPSGGATDPTRCLILDSTGKTLCSAGFDKASAIIFPGCWSPDGKSLLVVKDEEGSVLVSVPSGAKRNLPVKWPFYAEDGRLYTSRSVSGGVLVEKMGPGGRVTGSETWAYPDGLPVNGVFPGLLEGKTAWAEKGGEWIRFGKDGKVLFRTGDGAVAWPTRKTAFFHSKEEGYYLLDLGDGSRRSVNAAYNRMLAIEAARHAGGAAKDSEMKVEPLPCEQDSIPSFSPDDTKLALTYGNALYVWDLKTQEVRMLVSW